MAFSKDKEKKKAAAAVQPPEAPPGEVPEAVDLAALEGQLIEKTREAQESHDRMLRYAAEMDNLKKRWERERADLLQYGNENLLKELLPVLDNLERALDHGRQGGADAPLLEGLDLVYQGFLKALHRFAVTPIDSIGQPFDPAFHHAVMEEETPDAPDQTIVKELQKGYLLQNRLLRPAMVVVARQSNPDKDSTQND